MAEVGKKKSPPPRDKDPSTTPPPQVRLPSQEPTLSLYAVYMFFGRVPLLSDEVSRRWIQHLPSQTVALREDHTPR